MKLLTSSQNRLLFSSHGTIALLSSCAPTSYLVNFSFSSSNPVSKSTCRVRRPQFRSYSTSPVMSGAGAFGDKRTSIVKTLTDPIFHANKRKWGFVIIRGTYNDDTAWQSAMTRIPSFLPDSFEDIEQEHNIFSMYDQTILEDPSAFAEVDKASLRPHFTKWAHADLTDSIDTDVFHKHYLDKVQLADPDFIQSSLESTRHAYFLYINGHCLQSFTTDDPVVILIQNSYRLSSYNDFCDRYDPIESNPNFNVGWCYMALSCYVERYRELGEEWTDTWEHIYQRPPWLSDWLPLPSDKPFGPELNRDGTGPAERDQ